MCVCACMHTCMWCVHMCECLGVCMHASACITPYINVCEIMLNGACVCSDACMHLFIVPLYVCLCVNLNGMQCMCAWLLMCVCMCVHICIRVGCSYLGQNWFKILKFDLATCPASKPTRWHLWSPSISRTRTVVLQISITTTSLFFRCRIVEIGSGIWER